MDTHTCRIHHRDGGAHGHVGVRNSSVDTKGIYPYTVGEPDCQMNEAESLLAEAQVTDVREVQERRHKALQRDYPGPLNFWS